MKRWAYQALASVGVGVLGLTSGCNGFFVYPGSINGGTTGGTSSGDYVYVANANTQTLDGFSVGTNSLTAIASYQLGFVPNAVVVNRLNTMVVVAGQGMIDTFSIGTGGALSLLNGSANNVGIAVDIAAMDISPDGQWLIGIDASVIAGSATVLLDEFQISSSGQLTQAAGAPPYTFTNAGTVVPHTVKFAPNGLAFYVAAGTAGDLMYTFNTASNSGAATWSQALTLATGGGSDNALTVSSDSTYVFVAHSNSTNGQLIVFSNGLQTQISSLAAGTQPYAVAVNQAGTDVYVANRASSSISGYGVASGNLTALVNSPYSLLSGAGLLALAPDKSGSYMLAITTGAPYLALFSYDSTTAGQLDLATTGAEPAGAVALATTH